MSTICRGYAHLTPKPAGAALARHRQASVCRLHRQHRAFNQRLPPSVHVTKPAPTEEQKHKEWESERTTAVHPKHALLQLI